MAEPRITLPEAELTAFCERWGVAKLALFGSVLRDDFRPESDVDILVRFLPDANYSLFDFVTMEDELTEMLGRKVDLVSWVGIENSQNPYRREPILRSAQVVYDAT